MKRIILSLFAPKCLEFTKRGGRYTIKNYLRLRRLSKNGAIISMVYRLMSIQTTMRAVRCFSSKLTPIMARMLSFFSQFDFTLQHTKVLPTLSLSRPGVVSPTTGKHRSQVTQIYDIGPLCARRGRQSSTSWSARGGSILSPTTQ